MTNVTLEVVGGVDTHADTHHAAVVDTAGRQLADRQFPTTEAGYVALIGFLVSFGTLLRVGVEGTGSYGAGLARALRAHHIHVAEVIRPNRQLRRIRGKSDPIDAYAAARAALAEPDLPVPKVADGQVEAIRQLLVARRSAVKARTAAQVQIKTLLVTAPTPVRAKYRTLTDTALISALSRTRSSEDTTTDATLRALRSLARRHQYLTGEIADLDQTLEQLVTATNPALAATKGIGPVTAGQLLVTAGDNPERLRSEAAFAALCGVSPIPASSGKTTRHRLNRGGDRHANAALHHIALSRMSYEPRTRDYVAKKRGDGKTTKEALRCLKRAIAREIFTLLTSNVDVPRIDDLRPLRQARGISIETAAHHFGVWPMKISTIERGKRRDDDFTHTYRQWLLTT
ncbi:MULTISPECIES: IS110 family transposase [Microbacterium]|uniref:IS110 family transposase n=1 Tax=Microbacterium sp. SORGH_AS_0969 TaxID=3041793 RepID=UPI0027852250|nr:MULTISPECIES: IS110 family transposase [Microbacterium]MDQ1076715.1 transposase [Microbacterium sp. SORGH_AS_0969]MDQ1116951.1 transposase [Microbacterium testaceum]